MAKKEKKGKKGPSAQYITRSMALSKLQLSLADFRRLCILKGIYPRDPKKKLKGRDKTYYHIKDIKFLQCEPLLDKFREIKAFMKKVKKAVSKGQKQNAKSLLQRKPDYTLHHLLKERYPTFVDAIRDLDDALCTVALFASLPANDEREIPANVIRESSTILQEFHSFVAETKSLRKVFVSIKGFYLQAEILGQQVTWLIPHQFTLNLPGEVDFRVLVTFLEFYRTLIKFSNFKLYQLEDLAYPPSINKSVWELGGGFLSMKIKRLRPEIKNDVKTVKAEDDNASKSTSTKLGNELTKKVIDAENVDEEVEGVDQAGESVQFEGSEDVKRIQEREEETNKLKGLFSHMKVFINREIPRGPVALVLKSGGATVGWQGEGSPFTEDDEDITHQIVDRPIVKKETDKKVIREYVQPQWVFDSFNAVYLLPVAPYGPSAKCPPHLSPFVDDSKEGYVPQQRRILDAITKRSNAEGGKAEVDDEEAEDIEEMEMQYLNEIEEESGGQKKRKREGEEEGKKGKKKKEAEKMKSIASNVEEEEEEDDEEEEEEDEDMDEESEEEEEEEGGESDLEEEEEEEEVVVVKKSKKEREAEEERERAKTMLTNKQRRLLHKIEYGKNLKDTQAQKLVQKRMAIEKSKKKK